jgi:hypothetical protein
MDLVRSIHRIDSALLSAFCNNISLCELLVVEHCWMDGVLDRSHHTSRHIAQYSKISMGTLVAVIPCGSRAIVTVVRMCMGRKKAP